VKTMWPDERVDFTQFMLKLMAKDLLRCRRAARRPVAATARCSPGFQRALDPGMARRTCRRSSNRCVAESQLRQAKKFP